MAAAEVLAAEAAGGAAPEAPVHDPVLAASMAAAAAAQAAIPAAPPRDPPAAASALAAGHAAGVVSVALAASEWREVLARGGCGGWDSDEEPPL